MRGAEDGFLLRWSYISGKFSFMERKTQNHTFHSHLARMNVKVLLLLVLIVAKQATRLPWPLFKPYWGQGRPYPLPFHPGHLHKPSTPCTRSCTVARPIATTIIKGVRTIYDSSIHVLLAVRQCNQREVVLFDKNQIYTIGTALDLRKLKNVKLNIQGTIKLTYMDDSI